MLSNKTFSKFSQIQFFSPHNLEEILHKREHKSSAVRASELWPTGPSTLTSLLKFVSATDHSENS